MLKQKWVLSLILNNWVKITLTVPNSRSMAMRLMGPNTVYSRSPTSSNCCKVQKMARRKMKTSLIYWRQRLMAPSPAVILFRSNKLTITARFRRSSTMPNKVPNTKSSKWTRVVYQIILLAKSALSSRNNKLYQLLRKSMESINSQIVKLS